MSFETLREENDLSNPAHLAEYLDAEPEPEACEQCWRRWERKLNVGPGVGQTPMDVALCLYEAPEFNAACPMCVDGFEAEVALQLAIAARYANVA